MNVRFLKPGFGLLLVAAALGACKSNTSDKKDKIMGSWRAVKMENKDMDEFFANSQKYIDTIGKGNSNEVNMQIYGVTNMDSVRKSLQIQYDSAKNMQMGAIKNTVITLKKDGIALTDFNGAVDSSRWTIANDTLVLEEMGDVGKGEKVRMNIKKLTDNELVLDIHSNEDSSTSMVTFQPEKVK